MGKSSASENLLEANSNSLPRSQSQKNSAASLRAVPMVNISPEILSENGLQNQNGQEGQNGLEGQNGGLQLNLVQNPSNLTLANSKKNSRSNTSLVSITKKL